MLEKTQIGSIRILESLARGGSGSVFIGFDEKLHRRVALKAIRRDRLTEQARGRLLREARVLSRLADPRICAIYDFVEDDDAAFLVLELIEGQNLRDALSLDLSWRRKLHIAEEVAGALALAHAKGIVHRDIKLENVMLAADGRVRVLDFGLAWLPEETPEIPSQDRVGASSWDPSGASGSGTWPATTGLTTKGSLIGTPRTMSPEQAAGEPAGPPSDIYSFGIFLQELFTELPAYSEARSRSKLLKQVLAADTLPMPGVDGELVRLIERLQGREPEARPTAAEALAALGRLLGRRSRRLRWVAALLVIGLLTAGTAKYIHDLEGQKNQALEARAEAERARLESEQVTNFLRDLLESAAPSRSLGAELTAREILAAGAQRLSGRGLEDPRLENQPLVRARLLATVGGVQSELGLYDDAEPLLIEALELRRRELGDEHLEVADSQRALAEVYRQNRKQDAEPLFRLALATYEETLGPDHADVAGVLNSLGVVLGMRGELDGAKPLLERSLAIRRGLPERALPDVAVTLNNLGIVAALGGDAETAERLFREGLEIRERTLDPRHPDLAANIEALAALYANSGRPADAEPLHRRVLEMWIAVFGDEHPRTSLAKKNLGNALLELGRFGEARDLLAEALRVRLISLGDEHPDVAISFADLASAELELGRSESADISCRKAVEIAGGLEPQHRRRQSVAATCAEVLRRLGQEGRAVGIERELASR